MYDKYVIALNIEEAATRPDNVKTEDLEIIQEILKSVQKAYPGKYLNNKIFKIQTIITEVNNDNQ